MSKLSEYLKLIPGGVKNISKVLEGLLNDVSLATLPENKRAEIVKRRAICSECPFMSENAKTSPEYRLITGSEGYKTARTDNHCTMCGCPIKTRTASLEANCGIEKYNISHPNSPLELKWEKYNESGKS